MTTRLTKSTLVSSAYDNVISFIDNRTYVADPRQPGTHSKRQMVYNSDPLTHGTAFHNYPCIIVNFPEMEMESWSIDKTKKIVTWTFKIQVRAARGGAGNAENGRGKSDILAILDDLLELFNSTTRVNDFKALNMNNVDIIVVDSDSLSIDNKTVFETELELRFKSRIGVN